MDGWVLPTPEMQRFLASIAGVELAPGDVIWTYHGVIVVERASA